MTYEDEINNQKINEILKPRDSIEEQIYIDWSDPRNTIYLLEDLLADEGIAFSLHKNEYFTTSRIELRPCPSDMAKGLKEIEFVGTPIQIVCKAWIERWHQKKALEVFYGQKSSI